MNVWLRLCTFWWKKNTFPLKIRSAPDWWQISKDTWIRKISKNPALNPIQIIPAWEVKAQRQIQKSAALYQIHLRRLNVKIFDLFFCPKTIIFLIIGNYPPMRIHPSPVSSNNIPSLSESGHVTAAGAIKRRSSEEVNSGGKFKFKDSMRDRFSHEFETVTENASEIQANETNPEFHLKRRRQSSRSCEHGDDAKPCTSQQVQSS